MWPRLGRPTPGFRQWRSARLRRRYSAPPPPAKPPRPEPSAAEAAGNTAQQAPNPSIERMHSRLPKFLRPYTEGLRRAPVSHITSFLILHEITAIVPLVGFGFYFYRAESLPWFAEGAWFNEGVAKFGNYFKKKGWLGEGAQLGEDGQKVQASKRWTWWGRGEGGLKLVTSAATAYTLTKMLLPLRLVLSVWATPLFARTTMIPFTRAVKGMFKRKKS